MLDSPPVQAHNYANLVPNRATQKEVAHLKVATQAAPTTTQMAPTAESVFAELRAMGISKRNAKILLRHFREVAGMVNLEEGECGFVLVDMTIHDTLDRIMPDMAYAAPGTTHERINQAFLPPGWTFFHDRHGDCSLEAVPFR